MLFSKKKHPKSAKKTAKKSVTKTPKKSVSKSTKKNTPNKISKLNNNIRKSLQKISQNNVISKKNIHDMVINFKDIKDIVCKKGTYNKKKDTCIMDISHLLNDVKKTLRSCPMSNNLNNTDMEHVIIMMDDPLSTHHNHHQFSPLFRGGSQAKPNNYIVPKNIIGSQGGVNGCNNQRLVYDSQGIIGCNQAFGTPSQGGQNFVYPKYIVSK